MDGDDVPSTSAVDTTTRMDFSLYKNEPTWDDLAKLVEKRSRKEVPVPVSTTVSSITTPKMAEYGDHIEVNVTDMFGTDAQIQAAVTDEELSLFANGAAKEILSLSIGSEDDYDDTASPVKFSILASAGLPNLVTLKIAAEIDELKLNGTSAPKLESIDIHSVEPLKLDLALPELDTFRAQHTWLGPEPANGFALSMSRCPKIETIDCYKFRDLAGPNYMVLPNCRELTLHRSECTDSLEILRAPKLKRLSVQAAYGLSHVRLWDLPDATPEDVENLFSGQLRLRDLKARNKGVPREAMPKCKVNTINMSIGGQSKKHLQANPRVTLKENDSEWALF